MNFEDCTLQLRDDETGEALLALMERKASLYVYTHIPVSLSIKFSEESRSKYRRVLAAAFAGRPEARCAFFWSSA